MGDLTKRQQEARLAILRDVERSGGTDQWSHLHSHGHHFMQVTACVSRGDLREPYAYQYALTEAGLQALKDSSHE
jgi:hypothetical protein